MIIKRDSYSHRVLLALRASVMDATELRQRYSDNYNGPLTDLINAGYVEVRDGEMYVITEAGRAACPPRRKPGEVRVQIPEVDPDEPRVLQMLRLIEAVPGISNESVMEACDTPYGASVATYLRTYIRRGEVLKSSSGKVTYRLAPGKTAEALYKTALNRRGKYPRASKPQRMRDAVPVFLGGL